jgi:hypothetical protein
MELPGECKDLLCSLGLVWLWSFGPRPDFQTLFKYIQTQKGLISAMRSNGPLSVIENLRVKPESSAGHSDLILVDILVSLTRSVLFGAPQIPSGIR